MTTADGIRGAATVSALRAYGTEGGRLARALLAFCALVAALFAAFATATPARADTQAAYLADRLRESPVYVSDQLPRDVPKSMTPDFAEVAKRTGVPTYVLVLPGQAADGEALLGAVHDRLGKDGLFVLIDESSVSHATAYGVSAPAENALTICLYELPYDAGSLREFELFAEAIAQGPEKAAARAEAAREKYQDDDPEQMYIGPADRENQSTLTGVLLAGAPTLLLLLIPYVRRWRRRLRGATGKPKYGWSAPVLALGTAVAIAVTAPLVFDQTTSSASPPPRAIDLNARIDRVAEGLAKDPVYIDRESPRVLDSAQLARLHSRIERFERTKGGGPVFVAVVPQLYADESEGQEEPFIAAVRDKLGGRDGVFVVADPLDGYITAFNYGLGLDPYGPFYDLPESVTYGDTKSDEAEDFLIGERLDALMTALDKTDRTDEPTTPGVPYSVSDPVTEDDLPPLYGSDFWPSLILGVLAAGLLFGLVASVLGIVGGALRRRRPLPTEALPFVSPHEPTESYLRQTARAELRALPPDGTPEGAGDRYDAALLLVEGDPENLRRADPATLLTVIVLARAARWDNDLCCAVNPLHGPAVSRHHVRVSATGNRRRMLPVCAVCRDTAIAAPRDLPGMLMRLPAPEGGRVAYDSDASHPLAALADGVSRVADRVRESAHVH
ncbi:hypothetical protein ACWD11_03600 [Streptomyces sp. NPDC002776]